MREFLQRPDWMQHAACKGLTSLMFPGGDDKGNPVNQSVKTAREVCAACPVRSECREYSVHMEPMYTRCGVWSGLTDKGLRTERKQRRTAA